MNEYQVNEIFYSLQGEGHRVGTPYVFIRLSGCNLTCRKESEGFDCDTEFTSGRPMTAEEICQRALDLIFAHADRGDDDEFWVCLTGGEPALQVDDYLIAKLKGQGLMIAVETNGTKTLPEGIDWISCSPKTAEHTLRVGKVDELRYVRDHGHGIPKPALKADHYFVSPACEPSGYDQRTIAWCIQLVKENPKWRLSLQTHKILSIR